jgi:hypothetical protein
VDIHRKKTSDTRAGVLGQNFLVTRDVNLFFTNSASCLFKQSSVLRVFLFAILCLPPDLWLGRLPSPNVVMKFAGGEGVRYVS